MRDVLCRICSEPWSISSGRADMLYWENIQFNEGRGCPVCEGEDDRADLEVLLDAREKADPKPWGEPDPEPVWSCHHCHTVVARDPDDGQTLMWHGGDRVHYYRGTVYTYAQYEDFRVAEPTKEPEYGVLGNPYCPGCAQWCYECRVIVVLIGSAAEDLQTDDEGYGFMHPDTCRAGSSICYECFVGLSASNEDPE